MRIGEADVLHRHANQPPREEQRLLARHQHPREVIECGLRIATAHGFVQRADEVVMPVAVLVIDSDATLQELAQTRRIERL